MTVPLIPAQRRLRVLHVAATLAPRHGGPPVVAMELCRNLSDRGHDCKLVTTDSDGAGRRDDHAQIRAQAPDLNIEIHRMHAPRRLATSLGLWSAIRREVRDRDLVDIHQLYFFSTWVAAREARRAGVPYFVHPHGTLEPYQRRRSRLVKLLWDAAVGRAVLRHASGFICTTASEADGAAAVIGRDRTHVVALGATIGASEAEPPVMDIPYVLFLGRIAPKKRLDVLIESFAAVAPCWPGALVIAGTGDAALVARLKDLARRLLPSDRVRFLGHVEGTRKAWLLTHARAFVLPSENENFAISVAESLVAGTPVILTSHVATAGLVEHFGAGRVVDLDPNAVATALAELLTDDETHADLARGARAAAAELSWARTAAGVEQAYLDTLAGSRPALTS